MKPLLVIHLDDLIGLVLVALAGLTILGAFVFFKITDWIEKRRQKR